MIYVVQCQLTRKIKVGFGMSRRQVADRLAAFVTCCPGPVETLLLIDGDVSLERDVHALLGEWHYRGEWFSCEFADVERALATPGVGSLFMTMQEAADALGIAATTLWNLAAKGDAPGSVLLGERGARKGFVTREWVALADAKDLRQRTHLSASVRAEIAAEYAAGEWPKSIAERRGIPVSAVQSIVKRTGTTPPASRPKCQNSKLSDAQVQEIRRLHLDGHTQPRIAQAIGGVCAATVANVIKGKNYRHVA